MRVFLSLVTVAVLSASAVAQEGLKTPQPSPAASVSQTVGLTDITISYHRPAVAGRKVWGDLVPYGEVWRAGANENTTIKFSTPVKIGGKPLAAGTYGLHMIPTTKSWTIIFNTLSVGWGSYSYDAKEDALRVTVTPQPTTDSVERLEYTIDEPTDRSATVTLRWEKLKVPFTVDIDTPAVVMASMRAELRGVAQFSWRAWSQAADYWAMHGGKLDEAQRFADKGLKMNENFATLFAAAEVAEKKGNTKLAASLREKATKVANENELNNYGYALLNQKRVDDAIAVFQKNVQQHPESENTYDSLGDGFL
ncbi:MAG TPA: DUF2911 domain-containing protein, partial [Polyangia bacterium]|nr:DUF2911 domain-containing protein [Polyangia bacterium]